MENKPASLLVVSLGKALNGTPAPLCGLPELHRVTTVKLLTQHVVKRRFMGTHQWQSTLLVVVLPVTHNWFEMGCQLSPSPGVANRGALRQIWRIACLEVAHSRFKIFRAIWVSVLSSGRKICHSNNISKKKKKSPHLVGLTFGGIFKPKVMEKVQRNRG